MTGERRVYVNGAAVNRAEQYKRTEGSVGHDMASQHPAAKHGHATLGEQEDQPGSGAVS